MTTDTPNPDSPAPENDNLLDIEPGGELLHNLLLFGRLCRALGMDITPNRMMEVARALEHIDLANRQDVYHTMRALMVNHPKDFEFFDEAFDLFWRRPTEGWMTLDLRRIGDKTVRKKKSVILPPPEAEASHGDDNKEVPFDPSMIAVVATYSQQESLRKKDFAEMSRDELLMAQKMIEQLPHSLGLRNTRRYRRGKGAQIDLRRMLRQHMRHGGEVIDLPTRRIRLKPRPIVMICDVSGSMERYTRVLLHFMHTLSSSMYQVESFVFSTQITRITHPIRQKSVDKALHDVGLKVQQWGGGTKTGESLHEFNYHWSRRVLGRGAVVIVVTDGWDRGDIDLLTTEMDRLRRSCYRLIWLNPLLDMPDYEPLTRGAQAMLPYVDDFLPVRNMANLEVILKALRNVNWKRSAKSAHDHMILPKVK